MPLASSVDWFERLVGFPEVAYAETQSRLSVDGKRLRSSVNGKTFGIGRLEVVSLDELRARVRSTTGGRGPIKVGIAQGDVRLLHSAAEFTGALFQVASQFSLLEMIGPDVTPEQGVTRYQADKTQGPACAIAAGAATIYRNYFAPLGDQIGQTRHRQIDCLAGIGERLSEELGIPVESLWTMQNGYARCGQAGLNAISGWIESASPESVNDLRGQLRIGLHWDVEVTDTDAPNHPVVSQAFCSALPVAYYPDVPSGHWQPFATLLLEGTYEATLLAAVCNMERRGSNIVMLTRLGGGAFGNREEWIQGAIRRALHLVSGFGLDVRMVSYGRPSRETCELAAEFQ